MIVNFIIFIKIFNLKYLMIKKTKKIANYVILILILFPFITKAEPQPGECEASNFNVNGGYHLIPGYGGYGLGESVTLTQSLEVSEIEGSRLYFAEFGPPATLSYTITCKMRRSGGSFSISIPELSTTAGPYWDNYKEALDAYRHSYIPTDIEDYLDISVQWDGEQLFYKSENIIKLPNGVLETGVGRKYVSPELPSEEIVRLNVMINIPNGISFKAYRVDPHDEIHLEYPWMDIMVSGRYQHIFLTDFIFPDTEGPPSPENRCNGKFFVDYYETIDFGSLSHQEALKDNIKEFSLDLRKRDEEFLIPTQKCENDIEPIIIFHTDQQIGDNALDLDNGMMIEFQWNNKGTWQDLIFGEEIYNGDFFSASQKGARIEYNFKSILKKIPGQQIEEGPFEGIIIFTVEYR